MSRKAKYLYLLEKSIGAVISAIEIYNKPDFKYREETFSILMVNGWELLLKAKILKDNSNDIKSIYVENKDAKKKDGTMYKKIKFKKNRTENYYTKDIFSCLKECELAQRLTENIELLIDIRDNSIHFYNEDKFLNKKILEIGTASLKSYVFCVNEWFDFDLSQYNFYLMPISFFHSYEMNSFSVNKKDVQCKNLIEYISHKEKEFPSNENEVHNISLKLEVKFSRSKSIQDIEVKINPDSPISINIDEEEKFRNKYKWRYTEELLPKLKERYINFKRDKFFLELKKRIEKDVNYSKERSLDWNKPSGSKKRFYAPNILQEFDKYYTKRTKI